MWQQWKSLGRNGSEEIGKKGTRKMEERRFLGLSAEKYKDERSDRRAEGTRRQARKTKNKSDRRDARRTGSDGKEELGQRGPCGCA